MALSMQKKKDGFLEENLTIDNLTWIDAYNSLTPEQFGIVNGAPSPAGERRETVGIH